MTAKEYITYPDIVEQCRIMAGYVQKYHFDKIIAVTRGGMVPACLMAQFLDIRKVGSISVISYDGCRQTDDLSVWGEPSFAIDSHTLFVDDLYDSGNTYRYLKTRYPMAKMAVIYTKNVLADLDFPAQTKDKNSWLVFPWEFDKVPSE